MKIAVAGVGYVGLVTAVTLADIGHDVICLDIDKNKLKMLLRPLFIHLAICKTQRSSKILQRIFKNGNQIIPFSSKT